MAQQAIEPAPERRDLVGPGAVMVEHHSLAERHRQPGDPQIARINQVGLPEWVEVDEKAFKGVFRTVPARDEILPDINENLVVELYSK